MHGLSYSNYQKHKLLKKNKLNQGFGDKSGIKTAKTSEKKVKKEQKQDLCNVQIFVYK